ncbi:unnamed protein product [Sphagnum compactum]
MGEVRELEFAFDIASPYAYLASKQIEGVALRTGATLLWTPVLLEDLYNLNGRAKAGAATDSMPKEKIELMKQDLELQTQHIGVALRQNDKHPIQTEAALCLLLVVPINLRPVLTHALFQAYWELNEDIADESVLAHIAQRYNVALPPVFDDSIKDQLHQNTIRLATMGAFGVPCFIVNEHFYWGQDRLFLVERALGNPAAKPRQILSNNKQQPHTLVYYHDFGSHWSYLASLQVAEVAKHCGASLVYKPFFLVGLFKLIGSPVDGIMKYSPAEAAHERKDFMDWSEYLRAQSKWPSVFPIRSILALRVAICNENVTNAIYRAAWVENKEIAQPAVLFEVLSQAGFDAGALLQQAQSQDVKEELRRRTNEVQELGGIGAPTFQVLDPEGKSVAILWGQDRLNIVADLLCGWRPRLSCRSLGPHASTTSKLFSKSKL